MLTVVGSTKSKENTGDDFTARAMLKDLLRLYKTNFKFDRKLNDAFLCCVDVNGNVLYMGQTIRKINPNETIGGLEILKTMMIQELSEEGIIGSD